MPRNPTPRIRCGSTSTRDDRRAQYRQSLDEWHDADRRVSACGAASRVHASTSYRVIALSTASRRRSFRGRSECRCCSGPQVEIEKLRRLEPEFRHVAPSRSIAHADAIGRSRGRLPHWRATGRLPTSRRDHPRLGAGAARREHRARDEHPVCGHPRLPVTTVAGHAGRLVAGSMEACDVIALSGRFHLYEGHSAATRDCPCAWRTR